MIARPTRRSQPIPFSTPDAGAVHATAAASHAPTPIGWASATPATAWRTGQVLLDRPAANMSLACEAAPARHATSFTPSAPCLASAAEPKPAPPGRATNRPAAPNPQRPRGTAAASTPVTARYLGQGALSVRSSLTGRHYRFQGHGDTLSIDKDDLLLLRRIDDLQVG